MSLNASHTCLPDRSLQCRILLKMGSFFGSLFDLDVKSRTFVQIEARARKTTIKSGAMDVAASRTCSFFIFCFQLDIQHRSSRFVDLSNYVPNSEWELLGKPILSLDPPLETAFSSTPAIYWPTIETKLKIRRKALYYM